MIGIDLATAPSSLLAQLMENPINWFLGSVAIYLALSVASISSNELPPPKHAVVIELRNFTPKELLEYDGVKSEKIYMGVNGRVYDVTAGKGFYGPGGMYGNFAGRDASRGLAKESFDKEMLTNPDGPIDRLEDLMADEWEALKGWAGFFQGKYNHVGYLVENDS
ncbi:cytochrome b5-like heme/steroid binding domain-containing protein [Chytridium lagenaria]|nr:cytochrome b5-like heme/steroid binding domain-containing protein [Chytridium lagenaria]